MALKLTDKQKNLLEYISKYISRNEISPSLDEIAKYFNISSPAAYYSVKALAAKNYIKVESSKARAITILDPEYITFSKLYTIPLFSYPITSEDYIENKTYGTYHLPSTLSKRKNYFALKMNDKSIEKAGILENDILIFEISENVNNNDIILFQKDEHSPLSIRRYEKSSGRISLSSLSDNGVIFKLDCKIYGKLVYSCRNY